MSKELRTRMREINYTKIGWFVKQMRQSVIHKITREIYTSV